MLTTVEAEIDVNGEITLLEPLKVSKKSRILITLLENQTPKNSKAGKKRSKTNKDNALIKWLKENRNEYAEKYVALDGDKLVAFSHSLSEIRKMTKDIPNLFITKVFAEETIVSAGL